jgi:hypothetical protein
MPAVPSRVVMSSPSIPVEIVRAAGLRPEIVHGSPAETPAADVHLEPGVFPSRLRQLVEAALTGGLADTACVVVPRTSDADYKCFLYLREFVRRGVVSAMPPILLFDLLQSCGPGVRDHDVARTRVLCDALAAVSGRRPSEEALRHEIVRANAARAAARRVTALRGSHPHVTGAEAFGLLSAFWQMDPDDYVSMADAAADEIASRPSLDGPYVLLSGAPVDAPVLHRTIESHGAVVAAEVGPWGRSAGEDVRLDDDPLAALADKYRRDTIGPRTPADEIWRQTDRMLDEVDAVVVSLPPDDAVFGWDYPALRDRLRERALLHVRLRTDPCQPLTPADEARLAEMVTAARLEHTTRG